MCALGPSDWSRVAIAAEPEEKAMPFEPPDSMEASMRSKLSRFGLPEREYSKPCYMYVSNRFELANGGDTYLMHADSILLESGRHDERLYHGIGSLVWF